MSAERCDFYRADAGLVQCRHCPNKLRTDVAPERCIARCRRHDPQRPPPTWNANLATATDCRHRGEVLRLERNELCGCSGTGEPVYACALHGQCTLRRFKHNQAPAICLGCDDQWP